MTNIKMKIRKLRYRKSDIVEFKNLQVGDAFKSVANGHRYIKIYGGDFVIDLDSGLTTRIYPLNDCVQIFI